MTRANNVTASVLIPVFDGRETIERAIASALSQTLQTIEVIVIDDASSDDTSALVTRLAMIDPRISLIQLDTNLGPGGARNAGLRVARGDWVAILDADDQMEPERLGTLIIRAERDRLDAIADNLQLVDPGVGQCVGYAFPLTDTESYPVTPEGFLNNTRPAAKVNLGWMQPVIRREFLARHNIQWPVLRHAEDMVFAMRMLLAGARFELIGAGYYRYTQRRGTQSGQSSKWSRTQRSIQEQRLAIAEILSDDVTQSLTAASLTRLRRMHDEVAATTYALRLIEEAQHKAYFSAARSALLMVTRPIALLRCLYARYWIGAKIR